MRYYKLSLIVSTLVLAAAAAQAAPVAKQLAGPPNEFSAMAEADLRQSAVESKSAMIPINLAQDGSGSWRWQANIPVEEPNLRFAIFTGAADDWQLSLRAPFSRFSQDVTQLASDQREMLFGLANNEYPADYYSFENLNVGEWQLDVEAFSAKQTQGFVLVHNDGPYRLRSYQINRDQLVGQRIGFTAASFAVDSEFNAKQADTNHLFNNAQLRITAPDGQSWVEAMYDDGLHNDERAGDGIFAGDFLAQQAGNYTAQVIARGSTPDGLAMLRTAEHAITVLDRPLSLAAAFATTTLVSDTRMMVNLALSDREDQSQYRVIAEVWGHGGKAGTESLPVAWIGGIVTAKDGVLDLGLDARWIALAGAQGPFELRNLRVEDPDHFIPLLRAERINMDVSHLPQAATRAVTVVDEAMVMGERPADLDNRAGSRLLLVHGYCSANAWGPVAGQFTGESIFLDLDRNRSHNQFAQLILNFGSSYSSYGIVAHSQGGAASLHLYTYYWSGLDYASGNRLIQSVGTPYQGTSLAGNLAVLGQIFGVGCGTNTNLSYSGAAAWLSGIPSWARSRVNYYTTSFTDKWWRYDYCHLVTDLLLNDPDDGTTERSRGQISGAINRGHRTGWCHTTGMRDPAQVRDGNRNAEMNANAAR